MYDSYTAAVVHEGVAELFREAGTERLVRAARKARRQRRHPQPHPVRCEPEDLR